MEEQRVNILGVEYKILFHKEEDDPRLEKCDGYIDDTVKEIVVLIYDPDKMNKSDMEKYTKQVIRHEIIHGFLMESGLDRSACVPGCGWACNEEMVDWFAIQSPKIFTAFKELDLL